MSAPPPRDWWAPRPASRPPLRIGDAERGGAVEALGEHFATGRLTHEEYDERASRALQARTAADITPLFADLPAPHPPVLTGTPAPRTPAPPSATRHPARTVVTRKVERLPLLPMFVLLLGLALLLEEGAVLLLGLAALWWLAAVKWRRTREHWAARWHGYPGHRPRC